MTISHTQYQNFSVVRLDGTLRAPLRPDLSRRVKTLLDRDERRIVVDLSRLVAIDAAGVGELARAFSATHAAGGVLRITRVSPRVRLILRIAGVLPFLTARADVALSEGKREKGKGRIPFPFSVTEMKHPRGILCP